MVVLYGLDQLPVFTKPVITIGSFDGIHQGHRIILERLTGQAKSIGGQSVVITFNPHPREVIGQNREPLFLLQTLDEKIETLSTLHIDFVVVVPFTIAFANQSAQDYIQHFLIHYFHPHTIIIGHDHHFGKQREGNFALLQKASSTYQFVLDEISVQEIDDMAVSSSKIRKALSEGDIHLAETYLRQPYSIRGVVVHGEKRGRQLGYPTANLAVNPHKLIPAQGVYAVRVMYQDKSYTGMLNIGTRPTISDKQVTSIEVHLFDFHEDVYDQELIIIFIRRLRNEMKFSSVDELKQQLHLDKQHALDVFRL